MIRFENVSYEYINANGRGSLKNVDLKVEAGEVVLICGPSGCGKTTLIRCVNGLIPHFYPGTMTGHVMVKGVDVAKTTLRRLSRSVGSVFQNPRSQFFNVDTTSELAFGCENMGMNPDEIEDRINAVASRHNLAPLMDRSIFKLSGGEKQKIACASIAVEPVDIIVLDEPSANLDYQGILELQKMIEAWKAEHKTILIAEHRISYLLPYLDRALLMQSGEIVKEYTKEAFCELSEEQFHALGLRAEKVMNPVCLATDGSTNFVTTGFHEKTSGAVGNVEEVKRAEEKFVMQGMHFAYKRGETILDIPRMELPVGEIIAITGENGAGKSTFLRCLCGMERRCKATLTVGKETWKNKERRQKIYMVMQDVNHQLFTDSVLEEVLISQEVEDKEAALQILESLDLREYADKHPLALSGGQKQRVAVASAMASGRNIFLFDEPTSGLDYEHMIQVSTLLQRLKAEGKTVIIVTHDIELIKNACTCVISLEELQKSHHPHPRPKLHLEAATL